MPAIETDIWLALQNHIETLVLTPSHPIAYPNDKFEQPSNAAGKTEYLQVTEIPNNVNRLTLGSDEIQHFRGILQIAVMSRLDQNPSVAKEHAGLVAAHFTTDLRLTSNGVRVDITRRPDVEQGFKDPASDMWMTPVSIYYESFS